MNGYTPAQTKVIETWTEQRDALLREIGVLQTEASDLAKNNREASAAFTDIQNRILKAEGRLAEIERFEEQRKTLVSAEVAELEARKSKLEAECIERERAVEVAAAKEFESFAKITSLADAASKWEGQANILTETVGTIVRMGEKHLSETAALSEKMSSVMSEVITKGDENVKQTGVVLEKLPRYIFELQRPIPLRRSYAVPVPKGTVIEPEAKNTDK